MQDDKNGIIMENPLMNDYTGVTMANSDFTHTGVVDDSQLDIEAGDIDGFSFHQGEIKSGNRMKAKAQRVLKQKKKNRAKNKVAKKSRKKNRK